MLDRSKIDFTEEQLKGFMQHILQEAVSQGAESAEIDMGVNKGFTVTVRQNDVESVEYHQDKAVDLTVYIGKRMGSASFTDLRPEAIRDAVRAACNIARYTDEDPCAGLAEKELLAFGYPLLDIAYPWGISVEDAVLLAKECEAKALSQDKRILQSEGVTVITTYALGGYGNTLGFIGIFPVTRHEISCVLIAKQGNEMQRDYSYTIAADPTLLESPSVIAEEAVRRTISRLGSRKLTTRRVPVIFYAEEARSILGHFVAAITGGHLYRKSSFLLDQLGQPIFPSNISIEERPHLPKALGSAPFDDDGVATRPNVFVQDGILQSYSLGVYSARKLGMRTTGNAGGVHNLFISTSDQTLKDLLKKMDKGLLITELMGNGTNLVTGDYSQGAAGFWVERGEIQYPVHEVTVAGNLRNMYQHLVAVGNDVDRRGNIQTGSILLENMTVAGH